MPPDAMPIDTSPAVFPGADAPASPARAAPRFYLVGEAERSARRPGAVIGGRTAISINGRWHGMRGRIVTFEQLLRIAFPDRLTSNPGAVTMTFRHGVRSAPDGLLTPGDVIPLSEGLIVNATVTYAS